MVGLDLNYPWVSRSAWGWNQQNHHGIHMHRYGDRPWGVDGDGFEGRRESEVVAPSRMIAKADGFSFGMEISSIVGVTTFDDQLRLHVVLPFTYGLQIRFPLLDWRTRLSIARRHSGQVNILFADGHVGSESLRQMLYPSVENWTRFNYDNKKHRMDVHMPNPSDWESPTPCDELVDF